MITVIIPTRNRAELLQLTLDSLRSQLLPSDQFEVLVVDNGSTDSTRDVVERFKQELPNLRYFFESTPGLHAGRHRGMREARGDRLVFADDDVRAAPTWLAAIAENFADPAVAMVGGNNVPDFKAAPPAWLTQLWKRRVMSGRAIIPLSLLSLPEGRREIGPEWIWGCNFSIRKQVLLDAGGFHPDSMPPELIRFRGDGESHVAAFVKDHHLRCLFDSRASISHAVTPGRMTIDYFKTRAYHHGISESYTELRAAQNPSSSPLATSLGAARRLIAILRDNLAALHPAARELRQLHRAMRESYRAGFAYHQAAYRDDPEVRAWVHRRDYW